MSYEQAPATEMLATNCACCGRPLLDSVSVETGVGPECRKRHGYTTAQGEPNWAAYAAALAQIPASDLLGPTAGDPAASEAAWRLGGLETRRLANTLVHRLAQHASGADHGPGYVAGLVNALAALGFVKLSARCAQRLATVRLELDGESYVVRTPYSEAAVAAFRGLPHASRRWDAAVKAWRVDRQARGLLFAALQRAFPGAMGHGPRGLFAIVA